MNRRRLLLNVARVAVSAGCVALTLRMIDLRKVAAALGRVDRAALIALVPLLVIPLVFLAWRWWGLLRANGFAVPFRRAFVLTYVGQFFNQFLPGSIGGDVAKMYLAAQGEERKAAAAATVFLDRVLGLATMILVAAVAVIPLAGDARLRLPVIAVAGLFGAMGVGYAAYFSRSIRGSRLGRGIKERLPFQRTVLEVDGVLKSMRHRPRMVGVAVAQSVGAQMGAVLVVYGLARALEIRVGLVPFLLFEVIIFILTALPVSLGGLGVQELAYANLFVMVGVGSDDAVALSLLYKAATLAVALPGGLMFVLGRHRRVREARVAAPEEFHA